MLRAPRSSVCFCCTTFSALLLSCFSYQASGFYSFFLYGVFKKVFRRGGVTNWNPVIDLLFAILTAFLVGGTFHTD